MIYLIFCLFTFASPVDDFLRDHIPANIAVIEQRGIKVDDVLNVVQLMRVLATLENKNNLEQPMFLFSALRELALLNQKAGGYGQKLANDNVVGSELGFASSKYGEPTHSIFTVFRWLTLMTLSLNEVKVFSASLKDFSDAAKLNFIHIAARCESALGFIPSFVSEENWTSVYLWNDMGSKIEKFYLDHKDLAKPYQ